jgi:formylglycine-generating enzyme required for sulfatase activity
MARHAASSAENLADAEKQAEIDLRDKLANGFDAVPCPSCGDFQPDMVRILKIRRRCRLLIDALYLIAVGIGLTAFLNIRSISPVWPVLAPIVLCGVPLILWQLVLVWRFDPNSPSRREDRKRQGSRWSVEAAKPSSQILGLGHLLFFLFAATLFGLAWFFCTLSEAVRIIHCEPGTAIVVRNPPPLLVIEFSPSYSLRYQRLGKTYEKQIETDYHSKDRYHEGQSVSILFDPNNDEFEPGESLFIRLVGKIVGVVLALILICAGCWGWRTARREFATSQLASDMPMHRVHSYVALAALALFGGIAIVAFQEQAKPEKHATAASGDVTEEFDWKGETRKRTVRKLDLGGGVKMDLVLIPAGSFSMGSDKSKDSDAIDDKLRAPAHRVTISKAFYLGKYHVTVEEFKRFVAEKNYQTDPEQARDTSTWKSPGGFAQTDDHPVVSVSWNDAKAFCDWLSKKSGGTVRLPREAEWEYSCRAGSTTRYYFGDESDKLGEYAWFERKDGTQAVGRKKPNGFGLYDMHGNAWQWCEDLHGEYSGKDVTDQEGPSAGSYRVIRGGSFGSFPRLCRAAYRGSRARLTHGYDCGFRVVYLEENVAKDVKATLRDAPEQDPYPLINGKRPGFGVTVVAAGEPKPGEELDLDIGQGVKLRLCWIPGGIFTMGSPAGEKYHGEDEVEHEVELTGFWMAKFHVTQKQYVSVSGQNPSCFHANGSGKDQVAGLYTDEFPVEQVNWDDAQAWIKGLNDRISRGDVRVPARWKGCKIALPSEAQWEYAARGGTGNRQPFYWGYELNGTQANCHGSHPYCTQTKGPDLNRTSKVGNYEKTAPHPWGLCDMAGNVGQWCEDYYGKYEDVPRQKNPTQLIKQKPDARSWWRKPDDRVERGGGWYFNGLYCRAAKRGGMAPSTRSYLIGFRVVFCLD